MKDLASQLRQQLPGMSDQDAERFAASLVTPGPYAPAQPRADVPQGTLTAGICPPGRIYAGVPHRYVMCSKCGHHDGKPLSPITWWTKFRTAVHRAWIGA